MKGIQAFIIFIFLISCKSDRTVVSASGQFDKISEIPILAPKDVLKGDNISLNIYDFDGLEPLLYKEDNKTYIINFWATWCKPCVEELPSFEKINQTYKGKNVEVILVSLDMPRMYKSHLIPFIQKKDLQSDIVILDDPKQNDWIPKVNAEWSGAIPATIIYNKNKRGFFEKSFEYAELENTLQQFLK